MKIPGEKIYSNPKENQKIVPHAAWSQHATRAGTASLFRRPCACFSRDISTFATPEQIQLIYFEVEGVI